MGSGKSTAGKKIAAALNFRFIDMDKLIEEDSSRTISMIFQEKGEEVFREYEHDALNKILELDNIVVATGGGAPCFFDNMEQMNNNGITIYLKGDPGILTNRLLKAKTERPLIKGKSKEELAKYIREKLTEREKYYLQAQYIVDAKNLNTEEIIKLLKK